MNPSSSWPRVAGFFIAAILACATISTARGELRKPLGAWFSGYERYLIDDEFIKDTAAFIDTRWAPVDLIRLSDYSAILIGNRAGRPLSTDENLALEKWVAAGGTLIFSSDEPRRLWENNKPPAWVGGENAGAHWSSQPFTATLRLPDHPLAKGLAELAPPGGWKEESGFGFTAGQSIIGYDKVALLYENTHGKGRVIYAGPQFIPTEWPKAADSTITPNLTPLVRQFWTNLISYLQITTRHDAIAEWAKSRPSDEALAVWFSHDDKPTGGRAHNPPYPSNAGEEFKELRFDMGIGERVRRDFFVTTRREIPDLIIEPSDLRTAQGATISKGNIRLMIQDEPWPAYPKSSYWLVDPRNVAPLGSPAVKVRANETYTYWLMLDTGEAAPGDYTGELKFTSGDTVLRSLPLRLKVWPVRQPVAEVLHFEMEHIWFCMPGGYWLDPKSYDPDRLKLYQQALGRLEVDVGETWSDIDKGYYNKFIHLRADGRPLDQAISESPELFLKDPMPSLGFAGQHDVWWNNAIQAGMSSFSQTWQLAEASHDMARRVHKLELDKLAIGAPEHLRFAKWFWGEYRKYLRERGLCEAYVKVADEFGPEGISHYVETAAPMQAAGFKTYTTTYNLIQDKDAIARMDPYTDMWQIGWPAVNLKDFLKQNNVPFDPANEVWGTAASSFWGSAYNYGRGYPMMAARLRMEGLHLHGYLRWQANETQGTLVTPNGPCDSAAVTVWGQAVAEGRYFAKLYHMIDEAKKTGRGMDVAKQIEKELEEQIIGIPREGGPVPLIPIQLTEESILGGAKTHNTGPPAGLTFDTSTKAKVKVFEMLLRLRDAMAPTGPDVTFDKISLVKGDATCRILTSDSASAEVLRDRIQQLANVRPEIVADVDLAKKSGAPSVIIIGTLKDNPTIAALAKSELASEITPHYPVAGGYTIQRLPATDKRCALVLVVGGDASGAKTGVQNLSRLLTTADIR